MPIGPDELDRIVGDDPLSVAAAAEVPPLCLGCGYNLTGLTVTRCPECGRTFRRRDLKRQTMEMKVRILALKGIHDWIRIGFYVGIGGIVVWLIGFGLRNTIAGAFLTPLARVVSLVCGVAALGLGTSILRVYRLPAWARTNHGIDPNPMMAFGALLLGVLQVALPFLGI